MISDDLSRARVPASPRGVTAPARAGLATAVVLAVAFMAIGLAAAELNPWLEYRRAALGRLELWRLVTAHLAHLDWVHGALNGAGVLLVWWLGRQVVTGREWAWLTLASMAAVDAGLYLLAPAVEWYVGASGVLHGLIAGLGLLSLARGARLEGAVILAILAAKLAWEVVTGGAVSSLADAARPVVPSAHLYGAIGGLAAAAVLWVAGRRL